MSERFRESALSALVTSKRFIVATCAAIAMVLGAMSGGASFFSPGTHQPGTQDNVGVVVTANKQLQRPTSPTKDSTFTKQRTIEPQRLFTSTTTINTGATNTKKNATSASASVIVPVANLFLGVIQLPLGITSGTTNNTSAGSSATPSSSATTSPADPATTTTGDASTTTTDPTQTTPTDPAASTTTPPTTDPVTPNSQNSDQQPPTTNLSGQ